MSSGWEVKSGIMLAGVKISVSEYSGAFVSVNHHNNLWAFHTWRGSGSGSATRAVRG